MPFFSYKARDARGEMRKGVIENHDSKAAADQLFNSGLTPIEIISTQAPTSSSEENWWTNLSEPGIRPIDVQLFSRQLHTLLRAGVPIMRGLAGLQESATNKKFARVLKSVRESLDTGRELSAALRIHSHVFSPFYLSMVRVGEMTGRLDEIFLRLFDHLEFEREMRERLGTAMRYPSFVLIAMGMGIVVISLFVIPAFSKVYAGFNAELPLATKLLIGLSDFTVAYWHLLGLAMVGAFMAFRYWIGTPNGAYRWDKFKLKIPIVGKILLKGVMARFARSFALASKSGVPILQSINVVAQTVDNTYIETRIEQIRDGIERGESILRASAATGIFSPVVLQMIAIGEETGELDELMDEIAQMYEREIDYELKTLSAQIEPILLLGMAILVLILALGVFLPIWDLGKVAIK